MALTAQQFQNWLDSTSSIKCMLVKVQVYNGTAEQTLYLSNKNFVTDNIGSASLPPNTPFLPILSNSVNFTESLPLDGTASLSYGSLSITNTNGEYDYLISYIWAGRPISVYIGDITSTVENFTMIYTGNVSDIAFTDRNSINIAIRDILQRLNTPVTDIPLGYYGTKGLNNQNAQQIRPLVFGEVHNITPLLIDDVLLEYMVHDGANRGPIESIIEVRDNGVPVAYTPNLTLGTFKLTYPAVGSITCSVQGDKKMVNSTGSTIDGYTNTVTKLIQRIISGYGKPSDAILYTEMDLANLNAFDTDNQQPVGIFIADKANVISVCQELAASVGAQFTASRIGKVTLLRLQSPTASTITVDDNIIIKNSLTIAQKPPVQSSILLGFCKNWTIQVTGTLASIPQEHKDLFATEYLTRTATDTTVKALYRLSTLPVQVDTLILSDNNYHVSVEAARRLSIFKVLRTTFTMDCTSSAMSIKLGDMINLTHYRFGLASSKPGQVISIATDWDSGIVKLEVFV